MAAPKRRTQAERRESSIARLVEAAIATLSEKGYSQLTVAEVCRRAKLSQGALFRHFPNRIALIAAATEEVCRRHLELITDGVSKLRSSAGDSSIETLVHSLRQASRTAEHAAWHEVMVAARTHPDLHLLVAPTLQQFEADILAAISALDRPSGKPGRLGVVLLSVFHLLDSEAVTVAVYPNPSLESARGDWLVELLRRELSQ